MAEAEVEASNVNRFFCHKCTTEITPLPEYICPRCNSGFIEILEGPPDSDSDSSSDLELDVDFLYDLQSSQSNSESSASGGASSSGPRRSQRFRNTLNPPHGRRRHARPNAMAPVLQDLLWQVTHSMFGSGVGGSDFGMLAEGIELPAAIPMFVTGASNLASNPGDYAWGSGGLDAIITHLMNQLDGTGPPPLPKEKIDLIPTVKITQEQCDKNLQCSVCMEDFKLAEKVRKLNCDHCYHTECIIPWLKLHATCPICRKTLTDANDDSNHIHLNLFGSNPSSETSESASSESTRASRSSRSRRNAGPSPHLNFMEEDLD